MVMVTVPRALWPLWKILSTAKKHQYCGDIENARAYNVIFTEMSLNLTIFIHFWHDKIMGLMSRNQRKNYDKKVLRLASLDNCPTFSKRRDLGGNQRGG